MTSDIYSTQHRGNPLIPWQTALARITEGVEALQRPAETVALEDALGRVLAADVVLPDPCSPANKSTMGWPGFFGSAETSGAINSTSAV